MSVTKNCFLLQPAGGDRDIINSGASSSFEHEMSFEHAKDSCKTQEAIEQSRWPLGGPVFSIYDVFWTKSLQKIFVLCSF